MARNEPIRLVRRIVATEGRVPRAIAVEMERERPRVRGDCIDGPRPCPWVACRYHLALDVSSGGGLQIHFEPGDLDPATGQPMPTCALDLADSRDLTLESIGAILGCTKEWARRIEESGLKNAADAGLISRVDREGM